MENENVKLTNNEWYILNVLWEESPKSFMQLVKALKNSREWAKSTTATTLRRMEDKGFIRVDESEKTKMYYPLVEKDKAIIEETNNFIDKIYNGSIKMMLNTFVNNNSLSEKDISDLKKILETAEKENGGR